MLDEWIRKNNAGEERGSILRSRKGQYALVILICLGLLALIWPVANTDNSGSSNLPTGVNPESATGEPGGSSQVAAELESILSQIEGAGRVDVSVTLASSGQKTYATNVRDERREIEEKDRQGVNKTSVEQTVSQDLAVSSGSPLLIEEISPAVTGVLVLADGARYPDIKEKITNATSTLLDIPVHKVQVLTREGGI